MQNEGNKYGYSVNDTCPTDSEEWLKQFGGGEVPARQVSEGWEDAPGSYAKVRAG